MYPFNPTLSLAAPVWVSAFRPFFLLGALYGLIVIIAWTGAFAGFWGLPAAAAGLPLWHGHEMIFGFAAAIIVGILFTALPSWAGTSEIHGLPLAVLATLWLAGRLAAWTAPWLAPQWPALIDALLLPVVSVMVTVQLLRVVNRLYLLLVPVLFALCIANVVYHYGVIVGQPALAGLGLRAAVYAIVVLFVLTGGLLTPIFTANALREKRRGEAVPRAPRLEAAAVATVVLLAVLDLAGASPTRVGVAAFACAVLHGWRLWRWQGWRVADVPLVLVMHLGFAWLVFAFALKAVAELTALVPEGAWLHAFTVGSLGLMMLGLMMRVGLRHTGRPLVVPSAMRFACALMFAAAALRLGASVHGLGVWAITLSALLWGAPFAIYLAHFGTALVAPSLPRSGRLGP